MKKCRDSKQLLFFSRSIVSRNFFTKRLSKNIGALDSYHSSGISPVSNGKIPQFEIVAAFEQIDIFTRFLH
jgi:hypothetical protein